MSLIPHHTSDPVCALCEQKLLLAHPGLQKWFREQIKPCFPAAHISWSYRDAADQAKAYAEGKTNVEYPHSPHNQTPAMALDLFQIDEGGRASWDPGFFVAISQLCSKASPDILWGGIWTSLGDSDHFQLKLTENVTPSKSSPEVPADTGLIA